MADTSNETAVQRDARWKQTLDDMLDAVDASTHLSERQKQARREELTAQHAELRAGADKFEADRLAHFGSTPPTP